MNISNQNLKEIPEDAVLLSEDQALIYHWKIVTEWQPSSETRFLRYTSTILGGLSAGTGIYINKHYRTRLKLGNYGKLSTYLPIVVVPAIFSVLTHKFFVQSSLLLDPLGTCPVCLQTRAASFQTAFSCIYPTFLAPIASFMYATRHYTYRLPSITEKPKEVFKIWQKMSKPLVPVLGVIIGLQGLLTMYLTGKEIEESFNIQVKMKEIEREAEEHYLQDKANNQILKY